MTAGQHYVPGGPGATTSEDGGFDILARTGARAYVSCYSPTSVATTEDYDAYGERATWDKWRDPDCPDYTHHVLTFDDNSWYLEHTTGDVLDGIPMSGVMHWDAMYAQETGGGGNSVPDGKKQE